MCGGTGDSNLQPLRKVRKKERLDGLQCIWGLTARQTRSERAAPLRVVLNHEGQARRRCHGELLHAVYTVASKSTDMGRKVGRAAVSPFGGSWVPILHNVSCAEAYLHTKQHLDPSNRLATIHERHRQTHRETTVQ